MQWWGTALIINLLTSLRQTTRQLNYRNDMLPLYCKCESYVVVLR